MLPKRISVDKQKLIVMPSALPWNWTADHERQTANILASMGYKVLVYLENDAGFVLKPAKFLYPKSKNIIFYRPFYLLPFKRFKIVENINRFINVKYIEAVYLKNKTVFLWLLNPKFSYWLDYLKLKTTVFDCLEYYSSPNPLFDRYIKKLFKETLKRSDYVFVDSPPLATKLKKYKPTQIPQGYDDSIVGYKKILRKAPHLPSGKPLIGYVGNINYRLDWQLLSELIKTTKKWNYVFVGTISDAADEGIESISLSLDELKKQSNVYFLPHMNRPRLASVINKFDVCLIPYSQTMEFNYYSRTLKTYDYLVFHKHIVATPTLESLRLKSVIKIAENAKEFEKQISKSLNTSPTKNQISIQKKLCNENSWKKHITAIVSGVPGLADNTVNFR